MKSTEQIEELRDILGAMVEMGETGPFAPKTRDNLAAVHNAICYLLEDGSPHADVFRKNWQRLLDYCRDHEIRFVKPHPTTQ